jgi:hypothetical protein
MKSSSSTGTEDLFRICVSGFVCVNGQALTAPNLMWHRLSSSRSGFFVLTKSNEGQVDCSAFHQFFLTFPPKDGDPQNQHIVGRASMLRQGVDLSKPLEEDELRWRNGYLIKARQKHFHVVALQMLFVALLRIPVF